MSSVALHLHTAADWQPGYKPAPQAAPLSRAEAVEWEEGGILGAVGLIPSHTSVF